MIHPHQLDRDTLRLAYAFASTLRDHLNPAQIKIVKERNARPDYVGCCASHDFCDANMTMLEAWLNTFGRDPAFLDCSDSWLADRSMAIWSEAWSYAKQSLY